MKLVGILQDQVHVVKQGQFGLYLDSNTHKLKRPKKLTQRWCVLTRCENTGQHTLHVCKSHNPESSVKESYPVQTSWSIKSAHCIKSTQRADIFKEEGFIIHMGRQILYAACSSRSDVKSWICALLEGVTLGFEYHCVCPVSLGGECMLVLTSECLALLCPLTGVPLRKWPYLAMTGCGVVEDTVWWKSTCSEMTYKASINQHNVLTLYNVLGRYLAHTNPEIQVDIRLSAPKIRSRVNSIPAENKYTTRAIARPPGLSANLLYQSQDSCTNVEPTYELMSGNHSTGQSSSSSYDSDVYEMMGSTSIYEDMNSPGDDMTSSLRHHPARAGTTPISVYMNMENLPDTPHQYIDILINDKELSEPTPPQLPTRNKQLDPYKGMSRDSARCHVSPQQHDASPYDITRISDNVISRYRLNEGLKSYQEQSRLEKEKLSSFSAAVLGASTTTTV